MTPEAASLLPRSYLSKETRYAPYNEMYSIWTQLSVAPGNLSPGVGPS